MGPVISHASYLVNIASPNKEINDKSTNAMFYEMRRSEKLGMEYLVIQPGLHKGSGEEDGLKRVAQTIDRLHQKTC